MIQVTFKNLEISELARSAARERIEPIFEKFPGLSSARARVTLEMQNSPLRPGPDLFRATLFVLTGPFRHLKISQESPSLYNALAVLCDRICDIVNKKGDQRRVVRRKKQRRLKKQRPLP